ncbi:MAG: hypothetical protein AAF995_06200 [Planctomycetota bacterium]
MNWLAFALLAWIALGMQLGLAPLLSPGSGAVVGSFVIPVLVYIGLHAPPRSAIWASLLLGVLIDLTTPMTRADGGEAYILGPYAIGCFAAGHFTLAARGLVIKRNPIAFTVLCVLASAVAGVVAVAFFTARSLYPGDPIAWTPGTELLNRLGSALFTSVFALVLSLPLALLTPFMGFAHSGYGTHHHASGGGRAAARRHY